MTVFSTFCETNNNDHFKELDHLIDNRPFLRALHGYGLCLWRLERRVEASQVFDRLLWLSPSDNLGVRFLIEPLQAGEKWRDDL